MTYETFDLFATNLKPDADVEQVKNSLAKHFKTSPDKLDIFFQRLIDTKEPEKIQKKLSLDVAQKNKEIIEKLGLFCDIKPSLALASIMPEGASYQCPACGHRQNPSVSNPDVCKICGVVGSKYLDKDSDKKILKREMQRHHRMKKIREQCQQSQNEINNRENKIKEIREQLEKKDRKAIAHPLALGSIAVIACGMLALQFYNEYATVTPDGAEVKSASVQASIDASPKDSTTMVSGLTQDQTVAKIDQLQQALPSIDDYPSSNQEFLASAKALSATGASYPPVSSSIEPSQVTTDAQVQLNSINELSNASDMKLNTDGAPLMHSDMSNVADKNSSDNLMEQNVLMAKNQNLQAQISHDAASIQNNDVDQPENVTESIDSAHQRILALINISREKLTLGDPAGAESVLNKAEQTADTIISPIEQIKSYGLIATAFSELQDKSNAQRVFDTALVYANRLADPVDKVSSLTIVGGHQAASGNKEAARKSFELAQNFATKNIVNPEVRNTAYQVIALSRAITADFQEALKVADKITRPLMRTDIIKKLADIQFYLGKKDEAKRTYSYALKNSVHIPDVSQRRGMLDRIIAALENVDAQTPPSVVGR